jgi:Putative neutral zinc metallopeptidase
MAAARVPRCARLVLVGAALAVAGCGTSSDRAESTPSPTPTATTTATAAATATATPDEAVLDRMPEVPEATAATRPPASTDGAGERAFLTTVFDDAQAMWRKEFEAAGVRYAPATITIFRDEVHTACGTQSANVGPFYCPADSGVYLDIRFFDALSRMVGVRLGDIAQAYCRPTALPASGSIPATSVDSFARRTSRKRCAPPPSWAATSSSSSPGPRSSPRTGHTVHRASARSG